MRVAYHPNFDASSAKAASQMTIMSQSTLGASCQPSAQESQINGDVLTQHATVKNICCIGAGYVVRCL